MSFSDNNNLTDKKLLRFLESQLAYSFSNQKLLVQALVHRSFAAENRAFSGKDNETLEFLGDAVLDLAISVLLIRNFPSKKEGELTRLRAALVNEAHLAEMARALELGKHLLLGRGEDASQGRDKPSILSSALESVIGAIFMDGGYEPAFRFIEQSFAPWLDRKKDPFFLRDAKSALQELLQEKHNEAPNYVLEKEEGPDHNKTFHVTVRFKEHILGHGSAGSKKEAEQRAAADALTHRDTLPL